MRRKILLIVPLLASLLFMNSCLKDNVGLYWPDGVKGKMYAEVWKPGFLSMGLQPVAAPVTFKFLVNIATDQPPTEDITLTIWTDTSAMGRYNRSKKLTGAKAYKLYPYIEILNPTVTIKAGTRNAYVHVKVWNAQLLNACDNFMAPIAIKEATGGVVVSDPLNNGARLMALPIANPYAAKYSAVGYTLHPTSGTLPFSYTESLTTIDCKTVYKGYAGYFTSVNAQIEVTSDPITVLGVACQKVKITCIDPATGVAYADGSGQYDTFTGDNTVTPAPPSSDVNYYNPVTKQFVLNYWYNTAAKRVHYEILTRN